MILPSGIATDHGSAALRRQLFDRTTIDTWVGLDNRCRIFPIHRSVRFVVLATTNSGSTTTLRFRCGLSDVDDLHREEHTPPLSLTRSRIESWSPEHLTIPEITNATALGILTTIADRVPALGDVTGWNVRFGRELNATDDRPHFVPFRSRSGLLPIVEGKQLSPFQVDVSRSTLAVPVKAASRLVNPASTFAQARVAYREVAGATNKLTLIAAMLPANVISTHTVFCLKSDLDEDVAVVFARLAEQPGGELSRATERYDARDRVANVAPAGAASRRRLAGVRSTRRARAIISRQPALTTTARLTRAQRHRRATLRRHARSIRIHSRDVPVDLRDRNGGLLALQPSTSRKHGITEARKH